MNPFGRGLDNSKKLIRMRMIFGNKPSFSNILRKLLVFSLESTVVFLYNGYKEIGARII